MAKKLNAYVNVTREDGAVVAYTPGDTVPAEDAKLITNPAVWEGSDADTDPAAVVETAPIIPSTDPETAGGTIPPEAPQPEQGKVEQQEAIQKAAPADLPDAEATAKELKDYAAAKGITIPGSATSKADIRAAIIAGS